jgi:tol-pal system protein YbgF
MRILLRALLVPEEGSSSERKMKKVDGIKGWIILWIGLSLFGCATRGDVQILDREIGKIYSQRNTTQKETDSLKNEVVTLKNEVVTSRNNLNDLAVETKRLQTDLNTETKRVQADLLLRIETLQSEVRNLSTGIEEYKEFLKRPSKDIERVREDTALRIKILEEREKALEEKNKAQQDRAKFLEERMKEIDRNLKGREVNLKEIEGRLKGLDGKIDQLASKQLEMEKSISSKEISSEEGKGLGTGAGSFYKDAYETFQRGDLEGARRKFEAFLKQYPNTELSDNAQFWIGETYYQKKDFEKAILEYEKAIAKYPEGDKISAALFKQALAFLELGDKTNARNLLKRVIERYPHSDQAEMAKKKLEGIK